MAKYKTFPIFQISATNTLTPVTNPTAVELWTTGAGAAKIKSIADGTILNNYDGTYQMDIEGLTSGVYDIKVNFGAGLTTPDEFHNIYIAGDDALLESYVDDDTLEFISDSLRVKDDGIDSTKIAADVAGDGLKQNAGGDLSPDVDGTTIEVDATTKKLKVKSGVFGSQADLDTAEAAIDTLEASVGTLTWMSTLLQAANPTNLVDAIKVVASYVNIALQALSGTAEAILKRRVIYSDQTFAANAAGSAAAALPISEETSTSAVYKRFGLFNKEATDTVVKVVFKAKVSAGIGNITIEGLTVDVVAVTISDTNYVQHTQLIDVSGMINGIFEWSMALYKAGGGTIYLKDVQVEAY